jgi:hypothetical protein
MMMKMLMPNEFNEPPSRRRVAELERPDLPVWFEV